MSNTTIGPAYKGSRFWMQQIVNSIVLTKQFEKKIKTGKIEWISPIKANENYKEYKLNWVQKNTGEIISDILNIKSSGVCSGKWKSLRPQWDAIGYVDNNDGGRKIILVEAKAHLEEIKGSGCGAKKQGRSYLDIRNILMDTHTSPSNNKKTDLNTTSIFKDNIWLGTYYQTANRLAIWKKLNDEGFDTILVFLNIVNDFTHIPTEISEWYREMPKGFIELLGHTNLPKSIKTIYFDVNPNGFI